MRQSRLQEACLYSVILEMLRAGGGGRFGEYRVLRNVLEDVLADFLVLSKLGLFVNAVVVVVLQAGGSAACY